MRFELIDFRYLTLADQPDPLGFNDGLAWSRVYEYPLALRFLRKVGARTVHNSSWGFEGIHVVFKDALDREFDALHTDQRASELPRTSVYDICKQPAPELVQRFDAVLNISVLEEVPHDPVAILMNLLDQVRVGGHLFVTFDVPGLDLPRVEALVGRHIEDQSMRVTGDNSPVRNPSYGYLSCGVLILRR
jgi:SAM-dependent methyltransferase